jgi:pyridoxine 5-phosphate synthase
MTLMPKLGVNIDHVATLRQARRVAYPSPLEAALIAERAGADAITVHLREDRRHIQDRDLFELRDAIKVALNQELAPVEEMVELALRIHPAHACLVPERRQEITTEGGLDAAGLGSRLEPIIKKFRKAKIGVSLFIDPEPGQIQAAARLGAEYVELHTGTYANCADRDLALAGRPKRKAASMMETLREKTRAELEKIRSGVAMARQLGLKPNVGHGLNYANLEPIAAIRGVRFFHIGHSIVARAVFVGMAKAVREMKALLSK